MQPITSTPRSPTPSGTITLGEIEFLVDTGQVASIVLGNARLVSVEDLSEYVAAHRSTEPPQAELKGARR